MADFGQVLARALVRLAMGVDAAPPPPAPGDLPSSVRREVDRLSEEFAATALPPIGVTAGRISEVQRTAKLARPLVPAVPRALPVSAASLLAELLADDAPLAPTYETVIGRFTFSIGAQPYTFLLSKVSVLMVEPGTLSPAKRKYYLSIAKGASSLVTERYQWVSLLLDYTECRGTANDSPLMKIEYVRKPEDASQCTLEPLPTTGVLDVLVPLSVRIADYFFPGARIDLQDAAVTDLVDRPGDDPLRSRLTLSAQKLLTGKKDTSTYGKYGFFSRDKQPGKLAQLVQYYRTHTVEEAVDAVMTSDAALAFFYFDDVLGDTDRVASFAELRRRYRKAFGSNKRTFDRVVKGLGAATPDPSITIAECAEHLLKLNETAPKTEEGAKLAQGARDAFSSLEAMFLGYFSLRMQTLIRDRWDAYASTHEIGYVALAADQPAQEGNTYDYRREKESIFNIIPRARQAVSAPVRRELSAHQRRYIETMASEIAQVRANERARVSERAAD